MRYSAAALAALALSSSVTAIAPAQAHGWDHDGWRREEAREHHDRGAATAFGIIGGILAGAAIASGQAYAPPPAYYYGAPYGWSGYGYYR